MSLIALAGCYTDAQDAFVGSRRDIRCEDSVPVCTTMASCVLDDDTFTRGSFAQGATRRVVVHTESAAEIEVSLYFVTQDSPGLDTAITWHEVGCRDRMEEASEGADVFAEAGESRVFTRRTRVTTAGDHLVEVFSDAQADYLLRVSVLPAS